MPRPRDATLAAAREKASPRPLHFRPGLYIAQTQPGFETIAASEIVARVAGAREVARRVVHDRAGMAIFTAPRADALGKLRTPEDLFALAGYRADVGAGRDTLDHVRAAAREAPFVAAALDARVRITPGARAGRRLRFRVVARMTGEHEYRRADFERAVARGVGERSDHTWRSEDAAGDVEWWATLIGAELLLAIRLTDDRMRQREYKVAHMPGSLRPSAAAALAWLSHPHDDDVVLDPFCGAATILIERAHLARYKMLIGTDRDAAALEAAHANVGPRYQPIRIERADAAALPLDDASVDKIVTNLPWGRRFGSYAENRTRYPKWIAEMRRVLRPGGKIVMLTAETRLMRELEQRRLFSTSSITRVTVLGAPAAIYVCGPSAIKPR
jgi:tRNA (guanine6-N2)-methyltransferase